MGMVVRTNTMALNAYRQLGMNNNAVTKSLEKLSSGFRINRAGDDAAGLAISEKMKAQITGLETASANAQDGISLIQTAEGNLNEVHSMLNRMVELATKSANGTYTSTERDALQDEVDALLDEINRISKSANFNGTKLLDGTMGLNAEAFKIGDAAAKNAVNATSIAITDFLTAKNGTGDGVRTEAQYVASGATADYHTGSKVTIEEQPGFEIDLGNFAIDKALDAAGSGLTLTIGAVTVDSSTFTGAKTSSEIAADLAAKLNAKNEAKGGGAGVEIGNVVYKATAEGSKIKFEYAGDPNTANTTSSATDPIVTTGGTAMTSPSGIVKLEVKTAANLEVSGTFEHNTINVKNPVAGDPGSRAGMDIDLTKVVKDGYVMTIDGKSFVFKTAADGKVNGTTGDTFNGATVIDVSNKATDAEKLAEAADLLSQQGTAGGFTIQAKDNTKLIHVEQTVADAAKNVYDTYDKLAAVFSANQGDGSEAKNVGTKLTITAGKIVSGDSIRVGEKTYTFVKEASTNNSDPNKVEVLMGDNGSTAIANLLTEVNKDPKISAEIDANDPTSINLYGKATTDAAPAVIGGGLTLQIGDTADSFNKMTVAVADMSAKGLGLDNLKITSEVLASDSIDRIKTAINSVSTARAGMGALQNRLEHTINNLDVAVENLSAANSRIRDTDMAKEMMNYTKMNVLVQSAQAMLAQANQQPQSVLQLLQ